MSRRRCAPGQSPRGRAAGRRPSWDVLPGTLPPQSASQSSSTHSSVVSLATLHCQTLSPADQKKQYHRHHHHHDDDDPQQQPPPPPQGGGGVPFLRDTRAVFTSMRQQLLFRRREIDALVALCVDMITPHAPPFTRRYVTRRVQDACAEYAFRISMDDDLWLYANKVCCGVPTTAAANATTVTSDVVTPATTR